MKAVVGRGGMVGEPYCELVEKEKEKVYGRGGLSHHVKPLSYPDRNKKREAAKSLR